MWQALLAAVVAGSTGLFAKHFFIPNADHQSEKCDKPHKVEELEHYVSDQTKKFDGHREEQEGSVDSLKLQVVPNCFCESGYEANCEKQEGVFRFSSSGSRTGNGFRSESKNVRKKAGFGSRKGVGVDKRSGVVNGGAEAKSGRRFSVCLKRRKTTKNVASKSGSCSFKDNSLFGWGLSVGMMYMMTAGKAEINKLNTAMDETGKIVQELKTELYKRKASRNMQVSCSADEVDTIAKRINRKRIQPELGKSRTDIREPNYNKVYDLVFTEDGECSSSVLTEEPDPEPEVLEMDQLEAELKSELQKLPWCSAEAPHHDGMGPNLGETEVSGKRFCEPEGQSCDYYQYQGVLPSELNQKLCHLLIEQQESQIMELESELHLAQSKLHEKEAELEAMKDCVRRLNEFSLSPLSDDEPEVDDEQKWTSTLDSNNKMGSESKKSVVGMKRSIDS